MKAVTMQDDEKAASEEIEKLKKAAEPFLAYILETSKIDGVLNQEKLVGQLAEHAAIHVVKIRRLEEQFRALYHNIQTMRTKEIMELGPYGRRS